MMNLGDILDEASKKANNPPLGEPTFPLNTERPPASLPAAFLFWIADP